LKSCPVKLLPTTLALTAAAEVCGVAPVRSLSPPQLESDSVVSDAAMAVR
jgi:hypothetical protein